MQAYKTTDAEIIDFYEELLEKEAQRRERLRVELAALGAKPTVLALRGPAPEEMDAVRVIDGPRLVGIPVPADESLETLPGWMRTGSPRLQEPFLIPVPGPDGDEARAWLEARRPLHLRAEMHTAWGTPLYATDRGSMCFSSFAFDPDDRALYVALMAKFPRPNRARMADRWVKVSEEEVDEVADIHGWGPNIREAYDNEPWAYADAKSWF